MTDHFSADLIWECTSTAKFRGSIVADAVTDETAEHFNSYQVKRRSGGGALFTRDPLNLVNKQTRKQAGFVNDEVGEYRTPIDLATAEYGLICLSKY
jgi:hypothetical protein